MDLLDVIFRALYSITRWLASNEAWATWASAAGTVGAVIVSLYFTNRAEKRSAADRKEVLELRKTAAEAREREQAEQVHAFVAVSSGLGRVVLLNMSPFPVANLKLWIAPRDNPETVRLRQVWTLWPTDHDGLSLSFDKMNLKLSCGDPLVVEETYFVLGFQFTDARGETWLRQGHPAGRFDLVKVEHPEQDLGCDNPWKGWKNYISSRSR